MGLYDSAAAALGVSGDASADTGFKADLAISALTGKGDPRSVPDSVEAQQPAPEGKEKTLLQKATGFLGKKFGELEAIGAVGSGAAGAAAGAVTGLARGLLPSNYGTKEGTAEAAQRAKEVAASLTYVPRTEAGQELVEKFGRAIDASKLAGMGPSEGVTLAGVMAGPGRIPRPVARPTAVPAAVPGQMASVGAAGVAPLEQARALVAGASPEMKAAVEEASKKGTVSLPALQKHLDAESLPVPVRLSKGQATGDPVFISNEQNRRARGDGQDARMFNEQNKALTENVSAIRESAAPDVFATTKPEIGDIIIDAYKAKDAAKNAEISKLYGQLKEANGGQFPLDAKAFTTAADQALHKSLLFDHVPAEVRKTMDRLGNTMSFENFESLRTNLARIQRSATADGNAKAAAGVVRQALEDMPLLPEAQGLKQIADAARAAAKDRFTAIESDPAYKAVTRGTASADKFIDKYITTADVKNVKTMKDNLAHDTTAQQAMAAGTMHRLRESALGAGTNFSQAGYNKALEAIRPKLGIIFDPASRENVEKLGRVARATQEQPRGSFVNNSNSAVVLAKHAAEVAGNVATGSVLPGTQGGSFVRKYGGKLMEWNDARQTWETGAGIKLKDIAK